MTLTRRSFTLLASMTGLAACTGGMGSPAPGQIDARADAALDMLYRQNPGARRLAENSVGMLVMPLMTEAGIGIGGGYGQGVLRVNGATEDYYSAAQATVGLQIGAQQFSHVLFFMTDAALRDFRVSPGWAASADIEYTLPEEALSLRAESTTTLYPVVAMVFGQTGIRVGATIEGIKYSRIRP